MFYTYIIKKICSEKKGQSIVDYMLIVALVLTIIALFITVFGPKKRDMAESVKNSMQRIISTGSLDFDHPLKDNRVREL